MSSASLKWSQSFQFHSKWGCSLNRIYWDVPPGAWQQKAFWLALLAVTEICPAGSLKVEYLSWGEILVGVLTWSYPKV